MADGGAPPIMPEMMHHYDLHVWLWKKNPTGMFSPTNPTVKCAKQDTRSPSRLQAGAGAVGNRPH